METSTTGEILALEHGRACGLDTAFGGLQVIRHQDNQRAGGEELLLQSQTTIEAGIREGCTARSVILERPAK